MPPPWPKRTTEQRFWEKVEKTGGQECWLWKAGQSMGYGTFGIGGKMVRAHRVSYEWSHGSIPPNMVIDHLCRNRLCVNPDHLEVVTIAENVARGENHWRNLTHCQRGHKFTPENTLVRIRNGLTSRNCRVCTQGRSKAYRARLRQRELHSTPS